MLGRGLGATLAPFFNDANVYGAVLLSVSVLAWLFGLEILRMDRAMRAAGQ